MSSLVEVVEAASLATEGDENPQTFLGPSSQGWQVGDQWWLGGFKSQYKE